MRPIGPLMRPFDEAFDECHEAYLRNRGLIARAVSQHVLGYIFARLLRAHSMRRRQFDGLEVDEFFPRLPFSPYIRAWSGRLTDSLAVS